MPESPFLTAARFAVLRAALQLMTADEVAESERLAEAGDSGDVAAAGRLAALAERVLFERRTSGGRAVIAPRDVL